MPNMIHRITTSIQNNPVLWMTLAGLIIGLLTLITSVAIGGRQVALAELQASKNPILQYTISQFGGSTEQADIEAARRELENRIFEAVYSYVQNDPGVSYSQALDAVLPITVTVPFEPSGVCVVVKNEGNSTATQVRITASLDTPIGDVRTLTTEVARTIQGGIGQNSVTVELDRITEDKIAELAVTLQTGGENVDARLVAARPDTIPSKYSVPASWWFGDAGGMPNFAEQAATKVPPIEESNYVVNPVTFVLQRPLSISPDITVTSDQVPGSPTLIPISFESCGSQP